MKKLFAMILILSLLFALPALADLGSADVSFEGKKLSSYTRQHGDCERAADTGNRRHGQVAFPWRERCSVRSDAGAVLWR